MVLILCIPFLMLDICTKVRENIPVGFRIVERHVPIVKFSKVHKSVKM